jgi:hypothetical protein
MSSEIFRIILPSPLPWRLIAVAILVGGMLLARTFDLNSIVLASVVVLVSILGFFHFMCLSLKKIALKNGQIVASGLFGSAQQPLENLLDVRMTATRFVTRVGMPSLEFAFNDSIVIATSLSWFEYWAFASRRRFEEKFPSLLQAVHRNTPDGLEFNLQLSLAGLDIASFRNRPVKCRVEGDQLLVDGKAYPLRHCQVREKTFLSNWSPWIDQAIDLPDATTLVTSSFSWSLAEILLLQKIKSAASLLETRQ